MMYVYWNHLRGRKSMILDTYSGWYMFDQKWCRVVRLSLLLWEQIIEGWRQVTTWPYQCTFMTIDWWFMSTKTTYAAEKSMILETYSGWCMFDQKWCRVVRLSLLLWQQIAKGWRQVTTWPNQYTLMTIDWWFTSTRNTYVAEKNVILEFYWG